MKNEQLGKMEARSTFRTEEVTAHQSRSVMVLTILSIIFLPLNFFTSVFGMNNIEWEVEPLSLRFEFKLLCESTLVSPSS